MRLGEETARRRAAASDHGVLATLHPERGADLVPVVFVLRDEIVAIPIDRVKPKAAGPLQRVRNLEADPRASLLCEQWDPVDWSRLWWVRIELRWTGADARLREDLAAALRAKYAPYRDVTFESLLTFQVVGVTGWSAA